MVCYVGCVILFCVKSFFHYEMEGEKKDYRPDFMVVKCDCGCDRPISCGLGLPKKEKEEECIYVFMNKRNFSFLKKFVIKILNLQ